MSFKLKTQERAAWFALAGALLGVLALHPITMVIYWLEFHQGPAGAGIGLWSFLAGRIGLSFTPAMLPMSALFAALGVAAGLAFAGFQQALSARERAAQNLREELVRDLPLVIAGGETEKVEFKESVRWDAEISSVNRQLETAVVKTVAGFLNARGGSLILGVDDTGAVKGLEHDFGTLKRADSDGYEQYLMGVVKKRLGGDLCPLIHLAFTRIARRRVCRVIVEPAHRPVYLEEAGSATLYLRMGNSTRRLDVREAIDHVARRWPGRPTGSSLFRWLPGPANR
ncbi:MAG: helix-turn-helix domain-containing protein [Thermoanaerobaculia bacterium]